MQTEKNIEINELKNRQMNNLNGKLNVKVNKYIQKQINIKMFVTLYELILCPHLFLISCILHLIA